MAQTSTKPEVIWRNVSQAHGRKAWLMFLSHMFVITAPLLIGLQTSCRGRALKYG